MLEELAKDEKSHASTLRNLLKESPLAKNRIESILIREKWHGKGRNWITDSIYCINNGLGAVFGKDAWVTGATVRDRT
jgi:hypothetical protein